MMLHSTRTLFHHVVVRHIQPYYIKLCSLIHVAPYRAVVHCIG